MRAKLGRPWHPTPRSTDEFAGKRFQPHGRVEFRVDGRLLLTVAEGPFNAELVSSLQPLSLEMFGRMREGGAWGHLVSFRGSALAIPEALADFGGLLLTLRGAGLSPKATAMVLGPEVEGFGIMEAQYASDMPLLPERRFRLRLLCRPGPGAGLVAGPHSPCVSSGRLPSDAAPISPARL